MILQRSSNTAVRSFGGAAPQVRTGGIRPRYRIIESQRIMIVWCSSIQEGHWWAGRLWHSAVLVCFGAQQPPDCTNVLVQPMLLSPAVFWARKPLASTPILFLYPLGSLPEDRKWAGYFILLAWIQTKNFFLTWASTGVELEQNIQGTTVPCYWLAGFPKAADSHFPPDWAGWCISMHRRSRSICLLNESGKKKMNGKIIAGLNSTSDRSKAKNEEANTRKQMDEAWDPDILLWTAAELAFWGWL